MKKFFLLTSLLIYFAGAAQVNYSLDEPRLRANRTASMLLTTSWQPIDFNGNSTYNVNTFGIDPTLLVKMCYWDNTNKLFKFIGDYDRNHLTVLYLETTSNLITTRSVLRVRFAIPNGGGVGVYSYFPFPDTSNPFMDVGEVTILSNGVRHIPVILPIYISQSIRSNGFRIEVALSNDLITLGSCNLVSASFLIQD